MRGAWCSRRRRMSPLTSSPSSTSSASARSAPRCLRSPTAATTPTSGRRRRAHERRQRAGPAPRSHWSPPARGGRGDRQAPSDPRRRRAGVRTAKALIGAIGAKAQADGDFKDEIEARFAAMAFYGTIEQLLTGWIFGLLPQGAQEFERAKWLVVETVCGGLEHGAAGA